MRMVCRMLFDGLMDKYDKNKEERVACLAVVGNFVIGEWILAALKAFDEQPDTTSKTTKKFASQNAQLVKNVVLGILQNSTTNIPEAFQSEFVVIQGNLKLSVANYLNELINLEVPQVRPDT
jgi:hypothetical protein